MMKCLGKIRKSDDSLIIEDWVLDNKEEDVSQPKIEKKTVRPSIVKKEFNIVPRAVLMKSGLVSINTARQNISKTTIKVNTARQVNDAHSKTTMNAARPMLYYSNTAYSIVKRPIHKNTTFKNVKNKNVNTARPKAVVNAVRPKTVVNAVKGNHVNAVKASIQVSDGLGPEKKLIFLSNVHGNPQIDLQDQGVIDSGHSRHMTGNMSYLINYEEIDGGYVSFGGNPKGGKIIGKGTIKTGNLDFENLIDESQVLLRVSRKNNMYSVDLKNIVPKGGLTCLFAKATSDESKLWHRRESNTEPLELPLDSANHSRESTPGEGSETRGRVYPYTQTSQGVGHTIVAAETLKVATKTLVREQRSPLPRGVIPRECPQEERRSCQKVKAAREVTRSQN
ncbi:hypothetical protein Tco_1402680 [Tanacetum coccineum]